MSELFDEDPRNAPPPERSSRRSRALIITAVVLVVAFFGLTTFATFFTDRLWYVSAGFGGVFSTLFWTRTVLFLVFGVLMAAVVAVNIVVAFRLRPLFHPASPEQTGLDRYREAVTPIRVWLLAAVAVVMGVFAGTSGAGQWRTYLLWRNGESFGTEDAYFGRDIGFFVFDLPWLHYLVDFVMAMMVVALIAAAVVHYLYGGIRLQSPRDRMSGAAQAQLSLLLGVFVLAKGADYWLDRFDLATRTGSRFTGMNFTGDNAVLPAKNILMGVAVICAILFFLNVWRRTWMLPSVGLALLALSAVLLGMIWPGIVQQFQVKPSEPDKEAPYIEKNIGATRAAYDIADVDVQDYTSGASAAGASADELDDQASSVPLVDPQLVQETFEQNQQARAYYSVAPVLDVDRYEIGGQDRALVLGVRELDQTGINSSDRNWSNLHTVYTHGNGVIAAYANQRDIGNQQETPETILWAEVGRESGTTNQLAAVQPDGTYESRIYFGEQSPDYSVVGRPEGASNIELDLPANASGDASEDDGNEAYTTYDGNGGVDIGSSFRQLLYAIKFGEPNFLLSGRVNDQSQVLYNRTPRERVEKVAPWLTIDSDPYPVVADGRIVWVLDGYTTTDRYPGSERESFADMTDDTLQEETGLRTLPTDEINYMRNSVKATVDAYDGTVTLYEWDETDPILKAWRGAFPDTVRDKADIPEPLLDHLRYPEDLFKVQRYQFARYHVTDPLDFFQGNNRWSVPEDPNSRNNLQPPYRLFVDQPTEDGATDSIWSLTSVFVPIGRGNLAAFVSVDSDATSPDYGKMRVLELPTTTTTQGPGLVANEFSNNAKVRDELLPYQTGSSPPLFGNLLTLPVRDGLIYVEPVYATRGGSASSFPQLTFVLVSYGGEVGIGPTLSQAIGDALGVDVGAPTGPATGEDPGTGGGNGGNGGNGGGGGGAGTVEERISRLLTQADGAFSAANTALRAGDLAEYDRQVKIAQARVQQALDLAEQRSTGSASGAGSDSAAGSGSGDAAGSGAASGDATN